MIVIPAIDLKDGKVVRLAQGKFDAVTQYSEDPVEVAKHWEQEGAEWLHVVDLDGAKTGEMKNLSAIKKIVKNVKMKVEVGGGIRSVETINELIGSGVSRTILGTRIVQDKNFLKSALAAAQEGIAVSLDCSKGKVTQRGWVEASDISGVDLAKELAHAGLKCLIYTDIATDGMLSGPNISGLKEILNAVKIDVIASGGISGLNDIQKLLGLKAKNLIGAITGKAIYEGKLNLKEAVQLCAKAKSC